MSLTRETNDGFHFYFNTDFRKLTSDKISEKKSQILRGEFVDFPKLTNQHPLKLHISLEFEAFERHKKQIEDILCEHISEIVAREKPKGDYETFYYRFKYIDSNTIIYDLIFSQTFRTQLTKYQKWLEENQVGYFDTENLLKLLKIYNGKEFGLLDLYQTRTIIAHENKRFITNLRFIVCDQFTIYFPYNFVMNDVVSLCKKINNYLVRENVKAGVITPGATKVTEHMNLRLEYLDGSNDVLAAIIFDANPSDIKRRETAIALLLQSPLYKELRDAFPVSSVAAMSIFTPVHADGAAQPATDLCSTKMVV